MVLGYDAEFVAGRCAGARETGPHRGHTWIIYRHEGETYLFDPILRARSHMIALLGEEDVDYIPEVSVGADLARYAYAGYAYYKRTTGRKPLQRQRGHS